MTSLILREFIFTHKASSFSRIPLHFSGRSYNSALPDTVTPGTSNFPMTSDIETNFKNAKLDTSQLAKVQKTSTETMQQYTDAWAHVAGALGCDGIVLDYEENWFATMVSLRSLISLIFR